MEHQPLICKHCGVTVIWTEGFDNLGKPRFISHGAWSAWCLDEVHRHWPIDFDGEPAEADLASR